MLGGGVVDENPDLGCYSGYTTQRDAFNCLNTGAYRSTFTGKLLITHMMFKSLFINNGFTHEVEFIVYK